MLLITLAKHGIDCTVELDGQDISKRLCRIEIDAQVGQSTLLRLTLVDDVTILGEAGRLEFVKREGHD